MTTLGEQFKKIQGGVPVIAEACEVTVRAIYKWTKNNRMPRTEYSEETRYAEIIASLPGSDFTREQLLWPERHDEAA